MTRLELLSIDDEVLRLRVISEHFSGMPLIRRFDRLAELFERQGPEIADRYTLVFEAWTQAEWQELELSGDQDTPSNAQGKERRAARSHELG